MNDFPSNSHKAREENDAQEKRQPLKKVVKGSVKTKHRSEASKLANRFLAVNAADAKQNFIDDTLFPYIRRILLDGVSMLLTGSPISGNQNRTSNGSAQYVSYNNYSNKNKQQKNQSTNYSSAYSFSYDDIVFDSRGEAEFVLQQLRDNILESEVVSVGDLYDLAGLKHSYTYYDYGWDSLDKANVVRIYDGHLLRMPAPSPINR